MMPSRETCQRLARRKFVRQSLRMVIGIVLCFTVSLIAFFQGQSGAAGLFAVFGSLFLAIYAVANLIIWRAGGMPD